MLPFVSTERAVSTVPPEETFLQRLLEKGATESSNGEESSNASAVESGLASRKAATMKTMKCLLQAIDVQRAKNDEIAASLRNTVSPQGKFLFGDRHALSKTADMISLLHLFFL